jgi:hypothetical protein
MFKIGDQSVESPIACNVPFLVTLRARSFTVHSRSGLPTLAKYKTFSSGFDAMVTSFSHQRNPNASNHNAKNKHKTLISVKIRSCGGYGARVVVFRSMEMSSKRYADD